jgi:hypothetical protein
MYKECNMFDMSLTFGDIAIMRRVVNRGIDSKLEGFTKSTFGWNDSSGVQRLECEIHPNEMTILLRRLLEDETEEAELLADNIVYIEYGHETI